mgnify:CR=1 FL=1
MKKSIFVIGLIIMLFIGVNVLNATAFEPMSDVELVEQYMNVEYGEGDYEVTTFDFDDEEFIHDDVTRLDGLRRVGYIDRTYAMQHYGK